MFTSLNSGGGSGFAASSFRSQTFRRGFRAGLLALLMSFAAVGSALADLTVEPITWDVVGLDSNRPLTSGPNLFPVGARVCSDTATSNATVNFIWEEANAFIFTRPGSLTTLESGPLGVGECFDAYFEIELQRSAAAFEQSRLYRINAIDNDTSTTFSSPTPRQIYVERLVSQNRNSTQQIRWGQQADESDWVTLGAGGGLNLAVGETYFIELITQTATAYDQIQSFLTLSNTIFQVKSVETTYSALTAPPTQIPVPNPSLYGDGCRWDPDPDSPNYLSCLASGKAGGPITSLYEIDIIAGGGDRVGLLALIYDRSGSSFHYNTDYSNSPGDIIINDPNNAGFSKRFVPSTIAADGTSTLRFTISNPNPFTVSGYRFTDNMPGDMVVADPASASSNCGGTIAALPGAGVVDFSGGVINANSTCTILVNVTVPFDVDATYPLDLFNTADLFVGDAVNPSATATATLNVTATPPPPQTCVPVTPSTALATWAPFVTPATAPPPTTQYDPGIASAQFGTAMIPDISSGEWRAQANTNRTLTQARTAGAFFEFRLDTSGLTSVNFALSVWRQNNNAPGTVTLDYGPLGGTLTQNAQSLNIPNQSNAPATRNFSVSGLTNLNTDGVTIFRLYAYNGSGNSPIRLTDVRLDGEGEFCTPVVGVGDLDPPVISKAFNPSGVAVGATSTLTFTLQNTNPDDALTGITFRDEMPAGMQAAGSFVNNGCGGTWGLEAGDPNILLLTDSTLAANTTCTLSVNVSSTSVGDNVNISDPVDSNETLAGNSAIATLTVTPPPSPASIAKLFDPNPLLNPAGATTLVFQVTNSDPTLDISGVAFADPLPAGMVPANVPIVFTDNGSCGGAFNFTYDGPSNTLDFSNGQILAGQTCQVEVDVAVPDVDVSGGAVTFSNRTGLVTHVFNGITIVGNDASAILLVDTPIPGVALSKDVGPTNDGVNGLWSNFLAVDLNDDVYFRLTVENTGEAVLTDIVVADPDVDTSACPWEAAGFVLPVADIANPEAHIAVCVVGPVAVNTAGFFTNTATVTADPGGVTDTDSAAWATTGLDLVKTILSIDGDSEKTLYDRLGQVIEYQFTVTNTGFAPLRGPVEIDDPLLGGDWFCPPLTDVGPSFDNFLRPGDPAPDGEQIVCTGSYTITIADLENMQLLNVAEGEADGVRTEQDDANLSGALDFGDAPASYNTLFADEGARHVVGGPWMPNLATAVGALTANDTTAETDGQPDADANQDLANDGVALTDLRNQPTSGGVTCDGLFLENSTNTFYYCAAVRVANPTSDVARLVGWVDFGATGNFDGPIDRSLPEIYAGDSGLADFGGSCSASLLQSGDQLNAGNWGIPPNCEGVVVVVWQYTGTDTVTTQKTFARFRISTDTRDSFSTDPSSQGFLADGEIEDHVLDAGTVPVSIHAFESRFVRGGLEVVWSTASETHNQGFYIWGETSGDGFALLTPEMVESKATDIAQPNEYRVVLPGLEPGGVRDLVITALDYFGEEEMYGYFRVGEAFGRENTSSSIDWHAVRAQADMRMQRLGHAPQSAMWRAQTQQTRSSVPIAADFEVQAEGMQRISFDDLLASGLDLTGVAADRIAVTRAGEGVPRRVVLPRGQGHKGSPEGDSRNSRPVFGPGSEIHFWGEQPTLPDALYIDTYVYRVTVDAERAIPTRIHRSRVNRGSGLHLVGQRVAEANLYHFVNPNADPWYMQQLRSSGSNTEFTTSFDVPASLRPDLSAEVLVRVGGLTAMPASPNHRIQIQVNGQVIEDYYFDDQTSHLIRAEVPAGLLNPGKNSVRVRSPGGLGVLSITLLDSVELRWVEPINAVQNRVMVRNLVSDHTRGVHAGGYDTNEEIQAFGWHSGVLYEIEARHSRGNVVFSELDVPHATYWASPSSAFETPAALSGVGMNRLMDGLGDFVVLAHPSFMPTSARENHPLNEFINHRRQQGWDVSLVDISAVQVHYGGGMPLPGAVNRFLADAQAAAGTSHVLLVGSDSYDYRDHLGMGTLSFIPTHYAETFVVKHSPSDGLLADIDGDGVSDLALGRWPVRTLDDLEATVQKVFDFEFNVAGLRNAVWMTDQLDSRVTSFSSQVNRLGDLLIDGGWGERSIDYVIYEDLQGGDLPTPMAARLALFDALESGRTLTGFSGHGSPTIWSFQGILRPNDVADLNNVGLPTIVSTLACYTTYFVSPISDTLAHRLMNGLRFDRAGNAVSGFANGAVAIHGAGTLSNISQNEVFMREVLIAQQAGHTLGQAVLMARQSAAERGIHDLVVNWTLLGDPTLRLD